MKLLECVMDSFVCDIVHIDSIQIGFKALCLFIILLVQFGLLSSHLLGNSCPLISHCI